MASWHCLGHAYDRMDFMMRTFLCFIIIFNTYNCFAWSLFTNYQENKPQENIELLQKQQVNNPKDPEINYNLGVAFYQNGKFGDAQANFSRALEYARDNKILKKQAQFNLGNSYYKHALGILPKNWEKEETQVSPK